MPPLRAALAGGLQTGGAVAAQCGRSAAAQTQVKLQPVFFQASEEELPHASVFLGIFASSLSILLFWGPGRVLCNLQKLYHLKARHVSL